VRNAALTRTVGVFNAGVAALVRSPRWGRLAGRGIVLITYTGRRSGRTFTIPVSHRRKGDELTIGVEFPDAKNWWRNFLGEGGPVSVRLDGVDRAGHATAQRDGPRRVTVRVQL
jgi:F420H(2)-dependent quinone reductase